MPAKPRAWKPDFVVPKLGVFYFPVNEEAGLAGANFWSQFFTVRWIVAIALNIVTGLALYAMRDFSG